MNECQRQIVEALVVKLVKNVIRDFNVSPGAAMNMVFNSDLFSQICNVLNERYTDGSVCVYADLKKEILTGKIPEEY